MKWTLVAYLIQVNTNGVISFAKAVPSYTPRGFPRADPVVAPFWGDVDIRRHGNVYYRESNDSDLAQRVSDDVRRAFPEKRPFTVEFLMRFY